MEQDQHYQGTREALAAALDDFKQLEIDEPEVAQKLGFSGYVLYQTTMSLGSKQVELLNSIESSKLYWIESYTQGIRDTLRDDILPLLESLSKH